MKKTLLTEINRIQEIMGINPSKRLLTESGIILKIFTRLTDDFARKIPDNKNFDEIFGRLLLGRKGGAWDMGQWEQLMAKGKNKRDLLDTYPDPQALQDDLLNDFYNPVESEALLRVLVRSKWMEELVDELVSNPKTFKEFQTMFPNGKVSKEGKEVLGKALNQDPEDEFISLLTRKLNKDLKKIDIVVPFAGKVGRVKVPFVFRASWWKSFRDGWRWRMPNGNINPRWKKAFWLFGFNLLADIGTRVYHGMTGKYEIGAENLNALSNTFYKDKRRNAENKGDYDWVKRNELPDKQVKKIIQSLKNAGVGAAFDVGVDDDEIIRIFKEDLVTKCPDDDSIELPATFFKSSQVAIEWLRQENTDLHQAIIDSMKSPIQSPLLTWPATLASEIINSMGGDTDWTDTTVLDFYKVFEDYDQNINDKCKGERDVTEELFTENEKERMFQGIENYPPTLIRDYQVYCSKWMGKIHPIAWIQLAQDFDNKKSAQRYVRRLDPIEFNKIHEDAVPSMGQIYEIASDQTLGRRACDMVEKKQIENIDELIEDVQNQVKKEIFNDDED